MTATIVTPAAEIARFTAAVRAALADLPAEDVDELTDGLDADLLERDLDGDGDLGDPVAYAEELRAAAGYPPRAATRGERFDGWRTLQEQLLQRWADTLERHPRVGAVIDFLVTLRPLWWVFRGWAVYLLVESFRGGSSVLPTNPLSFAILSGLVVVSVQFGRGRWMRWGGTRIAVGIANGILIVATPFLVALALNVATTAAYATTDYGPQWVPGLSHGGEQITNIFAYDENGDPIERVQLFDQNGEPIETVDDPTVPYQWVGDGTSVLLPSPDVAGRPGWNVYPLDQATGVLLDEWGNPPSGLAGQQAMPPFSEVRPLFGVTDSEEGTIPPEGE
jgi:hypothetical protein